jgi:isopentenyl phosphate kinase
MSRPVLVKLGGSILTEKDKEGVVRRAVARRLTAEIAKAQVPVVLFHGAGGFGHPAAARLPGRGPLTPERRRGVARVLAGVAALQAEVLAAAQRAALPAVPVPVHLDVTSSAGMLEGLPIGRIKALLAEDFVPVLCGTLVRDHDEGWRVVSADELMAELAADLQPRLAVFATDVDGVLDAAGNVLAEVSSVDQVAPQPPSAGHGGPASGYGVVRSDARRDARGDAQGDTRGEARGDGPRTAHRDALAVGADVTGRMAGKVRHGLAIADTCPVLIVNGNMRGRVGDALKGKSVPGTRILAP